jgi:hypothetical protein
MRRVGAGLVLASVFVVLSATAALANHGIGSGSVVCNPDGTLTYTFTVVTSGKIEGDVTTRLGNGTTPFTASETVPATQTTDSLEWHAAFHENSGKVIHSHGTIVVTFTGTCSSPTSPPPTTPPPTSTPPTHSHSPSPTAHVRGTGGSQPPSTAFTGPSNATPAAIAAGALLIVGLGLLWIARWRTQRN